MYRRWHGEERKAMFVSPQIRLHLGALLFRATHQHGIIQQPAKTLHINIMTRHLLRYIFRHGSRARTSADALPLGLKNPSPEFTSMAIDSGSKPVKSESKHDDHPRNFALSPNTPEPFGLEDITEEEDGDTTSPTDTASLTKTLTSPELENDTFTTRELVHAALDEARVATLSHLDTIDTMLALLKALDGFSATILELMKEMLEKKQVCEDKTITLEAVERAVEGMIFAGETQNAMERDEK
jgi:hypothetical protein